MAKLSNVEAKELNDRVVPQLVAVYEDSRDSFTPAGWKLVERSLKKPTLASAEGSERLLEPAILLGFTSRVEALWNLFEIGKLVPFTGDYFAWEPVRALNATVYRKLLLAGDARAGEVEQYLSFAENGGPGPPVVNGAMKNRLNGDLLKTFTTEFAEPIPARLFSYFLAKIRELAVVWAFGGSEAWPRPRLMDELSTCGDLVRDLFTEAPRAGV